MSYVAAGYAPLSVRLLQILGSSSWTAANDIVRLLPGPLLEFTQQDSVAEELTEALARTADTTSSNTNSSNSNSSNSNSGNGVGLGLGLGGSSYYSDDMKSKRVLLFYVVGGLSFLEIAAIRHLSKDPTFPYKIIMASDTIISNKKTLPYV
jgi:hypothetical protein